MAPDHPPCTPTASCTPIRCHPPPPVCANPERCLKRTTSKGIRPCQSAASIMATRSKAACGSCTRSSSKTSNPRSVKAVERFLEEKSKEAKMRKRDRLEGTHSYTNYTKRKSTSRAKTACCAGKGHRGRLKRPKKCCEIL